MEIDFTDAKKAVRRGTRSANRMIDVAHDHGHRGVVQARRMADDMIDAGDRAARSTAQAVKSGHDWMEAKPHLAVLAALAAGVIIGALLTPRR